MAYKIMQKIIALLMKDKVKLIATIIIGSLFLKYILNFSVYFIASLLVSTFIIYLLSRTRSKIGFVITIVLILGNIWLLIFTLIPTYEHEIDIESFYKTQNNYLTIDIQDEEEQLTKSKASIIITNTKTGPKARFNESVANFTTGEKKIQVFEGDKITFISKTKNLNSIVNINLWDGTVLRLFPQSILKLDKVKLNTDKLLESESTISMEKGTAWFNIVKTIKHEEGFNVKTSNGILVIRGTSGLITYNYDNDNTMAYSDDHIIEVKNAFGETDYLSKGEIFKFNDDVIRSESVSDFKDSFQAFDIYSKMKEFSYSDEEMFEEYKNNFDSYIQDNFQWEFEDNDFIESMSEMKMNTLSLLSFLPGFSDEYDEVLKNYNTYKALMGEETNFEKLTSNIESVILTPVNDTIEKIKVEYINSDYATSIKQKLISIYNMALDSGKEIDMEEMKKWIKMAEDNANIEQVKNTILQLMQKYLAGYNQIGQ